MLSLFLLTSEEIEINKVIHLLNALDSPLVRCEVSVHSIDETDRYYEFYIDLTIGQLPPPFSPELIGKLPTGTLSFYSPELNHKSRSFDLLISSQQLWAHREGVEEAVSRFVFEHLPETSLLIFGNELMTNPLEVLHYFKRGGDKLREYLEKRNGYLKMVHSLGK